MLKQLLFYLKVSRPGLWFATLWLYLLPTSQMSTIVSTWEFWYGLFYVCFPLNFLVYGWNDIVDYETDALNPRKDSFWFGARGTKKDLDVLWQAIAISQLLFFPVLIGIGGWVIFSPVYCNKWFVQPARKRFEEPSSFRIVVSSGIFISSSFEYMDQ